MSSHSKLSDTSATEFFTTEDAPPKLRKRCVRTRGGWKRGVRMCGGFTRVKTDNTVSGKCNAFQRANGNCDRSSEAEEPVNHLEVNDNVDASANSQEPENQPLHTQKRQLLSPKREDCEYESDDPSTLIVPRNKIKELMNAGSEEESSDEEEATRTYLSRQIKLFIDFDEHEDAGTDITTSIDFTLLQETSKCSDDISTQAAFSAVTPEETEGPRNPFKFHWKPCPNPPIPPEERREKFAKTDWGPTTKNTDPYTSFTAIWDRSIMEYIATETNRYAEQMLQKTTIGKRARMALWHPTDADELYIYMAIILATGIVIKSEMSEYWNKENNIFETPGFAAYMSYNRFYLLSRSLHFNDNEQFRLTGLTRSHAKIYKIAPIVDHLNKRFTELYQPGQNLSLEESLTLGSRDINQFIGRKTATNGIKTYELCESQTGYLYKFVVHSGQDEKLSTKTPLSGLIPTVVLQLLEGLHHKGHTIWMNSNCNSPALARQLKALGFDCAGTLRTSCQFVPPEIHNMRNENMNVDEVIGCTSGDVDVMVWRQKSRVALISTYHGVSVRSSSMDNKLKPVLFHDLSSCMSGIEKKDQMLSLYPIERKRTLIWYKKFFKRLLNVSVLNAFIMHRHNKSQESKSRHRQFRLNLVKTILEKHQKRNEQPVLTPSLKIAPVFHPDIVSHFTIPYGIREGHRERVRRACVICHTRVRSHCPACNVALCMTPCAQTYHSYNSSFQQVEVAKVT